MNYILSICRYKIACGSALTTYRHVLMSVAQVRLQLIENVVLFSYTHVN